MASRTRVGLGSASVAMAAVVAGSLGILARQVPPPTPTPRLAAGAAHSVAIDAAGAVWAWGANVGYQVGDGTTITRPAPVPLTSLTGTFTAVAAGGAHSLALRADGSVFGWGLNTSGEVGTGTTTPRPTPIAITTLAGIVSIAAGAQHSLALRSNGTVAAWGANTEGQLGDTTTTQRTLPVTVSGLTNVVAIAAGGLHSLALKADGTVWAWGANASGQIGDNTTTRRRTPVRVTTLAAAKAIAAGGVHSVAVTQTGIVFAWGGNESGQVGDGSTITRKVPVSVPGLTNIVTVAAGAAHTSAVSTTGAHWAWGANLGQLGDATTTTRLVPASITPPTGATLVVAGGAHSLARTTDGTVWSTGVNLLGPLGSGNTTSSTVYGPISGPAQTWGVNAPVLTPSGGTFTLPPSVTLTTLTPGATIHYTTNGVDPTTSDPSVLSGGVLAVNQITLLNTKAFRSGMTPSVVVTGTYTLQVATPSMAPASGTYATPQTVTLATISPSAVLYYTLDGTDPTEASTPYSAPVTVSASGTLKVRGVRTAWLPSAVASATYSFNFGTLATPIATPVGGTYQTPQSVALSADAGASIRYTLDGADPTEASAVYTAPIAIAATATLKARAFRVDYTPSGILTEPYVIDTSGGGDVPPGETSPPDPSTVAPPLSQVELTGFGDQVSFLYTGATPIQFGVTVSALQDYRIAVLRGTVLQRNGQPLPGARVKVLDRPEFGYTISRLDGMFDLAVNGGGPMTVEYTRNGFLSVQRTVNPAWLDYEWAPDIRMVQLDANVTTVDFSVTAPAQVVRGTVQTDAAGTRQATLIVPAGGVFAELVMADGSTFPNLAQLSVRATEYTVGAGGPEAMPGQLPPASGYTYAVELSADEATAANARQVNFNPPLPFYVDNFLNLPVGIAVPAGYYDDQAAAWRPSNNGRVVRILSIDGSGRATLDIDGAGQPAGAAALAALGVTDGERQRLAELYAPGFSVWRTAIPHFSPWDLNFPVKIRPNTNPRSPSNPQIETDHELDRPGCATGSIVECQNQTLGEALAIAGTPFGLTYRSNRAPGRLGKLAMSFAISDATSAADAEEITTTVSVAGQVFEQTYAPAPNQRVTFVWDGRDAYGRTRVGSAQATVNVSYTYEVEYVASTEEPAFGLWGGAATDVLARRPMTLGTSAEAVLQGTPPRDAGIGGWTLDVHHLYDPLAAILYRGDGSMRQAAAKGAVIERFGGFQGAPAAFAMGADGSVLAGSSSGLLKTHADGSTEVVSTTPPNGQVHAMTAGPNDDTYYVTASMSGEFNFVEASVGRYLADGTHQVVTTIPLGFGTECGFAFSAVGSRLAVASDRTAYVSIGPCLFRVLPDGDTTLLRRSQRNQFAGLAIGGADTLYFVDSDGVDVAGFTSQIYRLRPTGDLELVAGSGVLGPSPDGVPGPSVSISAIDIAVDGGTVYFSDVSNDRTIRKVGPDGLLSTMAGAPGLPERDGWPARASGVNSWAVAVGPDGGVFTGGQSGVRRIAPLDPRGDATSYQLASDSGAEVYEFNLDGRHLRTRDALTGVILLQFAYDAAGRLTSLQDREGLVTAIERSAAGVPMAIVSPFGQRTTLSVNPAGDLAGMADPEGQIHNFTYVDGLLTSMLDPNGNAYAFGYDPLGRLTSDNDPEGGQQMLSRTATPNGWHVTRTQAGVGAFLYLTELPPTGGLRTTTTGPDGAATTSVRTDDERTTVTTPDGTTVTSQQGPDPRFGMAAPVTDAATVRTPGGLTQALAQTRAVVLNDPQDLLSVAFSTETTTVNGRVYASQFDASAGTITSVSPEGRQTVTTLDALGRPTSVQVGTLAATTFAYDAAGRLATSTQGSRTTTMAYDSAGFLQSVTDPLTRTVSFTNDAIGRALSQQFPDSRTASFTYDGNSNLTGLTPPGQPEHQLVYTGVNNLASYTPPAVSGAGATTYAYDTARRPTTVTRADGQTLTFGYEPGTGRLQSLTTPSGATSYAYEAGTGRLASVSALGAALSYGYDGSLLLNETWSGSVSGAVAWTYDNDFRITAESVRGANLAGFGYDQDGLLMTAGATTFARAAATGLLTSSTVGSTATTFGYNPFGELTSHATAIGGSPVYSATLTRDPGGRISQQSETLAGVPNVVAYGYDLAGRLQTVTRNGALVVTYGYDPNGNRTSVTTAGGTVSATYDAQDRLQSWATRTYTHTPHGDVASWTDTATSQTTTYAYDVQGNLRQVTTPTATVTYTVDGRNRRIGRAVNGTPVQGFLWQGQLRPVAELDGSGALVSRFVYGTRVNVPEYLMKNGTTYRIVTDHLGSVRLVVDTSTNAVVQALTYDPWGVVVQDTNPGFQPFGYAGGLYDPLTGLVRFGVRDYDAVTGRWTAKDPIKFAGGDSNIYAYAIDDPTDFGDPTGELVWVVVGGVIGAAVNVGVTYIANGGDVTSEQVWASAASGAIAGALGAVAGPLGGTIAKAGGFATNRLAAALATATVAGASGVLGQCAANAIDPVSASSVVNAGFWSGLGGGLAKLQVATKNLNSIRQAIAFGPTTLQGLFGSPNAIQNNGSIVLSSVVGSIANVAALSPF